MKFLKIATIAASFLLFVSGCGAKNVEELKREATLSYHGTANCDAETTTYGIYRLSMEVDVGFEKFFSCRSDKARNRYVCSNAKDWTTTDEFLLVELANTGENKVTIDAYSWYDRGFFKKFMQKIKDQSKNDEICK